MLVIKEEGFMKRFIKLTITLVLFYTVTVGSILVFAMTREGVEPSIPDWSEASLPVVENTGMQGSTYNPQETINGKELNQ